MAHLYKTTFNCTSCGNRWSVIDKEKTTEIPACPQCQTLKQYEIREVVGGTPDAPARVGPIIGSNKSKAVDAVYRMAEQDYGMTDMKDNLRPGDIAYKMPTEQVSPEMQQQLQKQGGSMFGGGTPAAMGQQHNALTMAAGARMERAQQGIGDPMSNFQRRLKTANAPSVIDNARRGPLGIRAK